MLIMIFSWCNYGKHGRKTIANFFRIKVKSRRVGKTLEGINEKIRLKIIITISRNIQIKNVIDELEKIIGRRNGEF